jgi:uncharacterized membrane protein YphA (DoxX/SURF4 family)
MNAFLWTLQALLAIVFLASGVSKSSLSKEKLVAMGQTGVGPLPMPLVRFGAICELFGVLGILLPWGTGIAPILTPLAACGFAVIMVVAISAHVHLREVTNSLATTAILIVSLVVAIARFAS